MLTKSTEIVNEYNRETESKKLAEMFRKQSVTIRPKLPEGNSVVIFKGFNPHTFKDASGARLYEGFQIIMELDNKTYTHDMPFSAKDPEAAQKQLGIYSNILKDLGRQFNLEGDIYIDDVNKFTDQNIDVSICVKNNKRYTNFYKAKEQITPTETPKF